MFQMHNPRVNRGSGRFRGRYTTRTYNYRKKPYEDLEKQINRSPNEVLFAIKNDAYGFKDLIKSKSLDNAKIVVSLNLLSLACQSSHRETLIEFLRDLIADCGENYFKVILSNYLTKIPRIEAQTLRNMTVFLNSLLIWHPQRSLPYAILLLPLLDKAIVVSEPMDNDLTTMLQELTTKVTTLNQVKLVNGNFTENDNSSTFRSIPIFPDVREISSRIRPFLRKNQIVGSYSSVEEYLDIQYRLLREDFVRPLREGIATYLEHCGRGSNTGRLQDIKVYHNVTIKNALVSNEGVVYQVHFDFGSNPNLRNIRWEASKRLIYGNLVCLTFDNFQTLYFGTVGSRETLSQRSVIVQVKFENCNEILRIKWKNFIMVETDAYFEAFRYVLTALQNIEESTFPLKEHIVEVKSVISFPEYINQETLYCLKCLTSEYKEKLRCKVESRDPVPPDVISCVCKDTNEELPVILLKDETWPDAESLNLDISQKEALKLALTKKIAIIQGPPGTGKTYVGLKIMQVLLHNQKHWKGPDEGTSPIVVVCYTNHALDQFLEGVLELTTKIVRVGGRSSSQKLQPYCMAQLKRSQSRSASGEYMAGHFRNMKMNLEKALREIYEKDKQLKSSGNIILSESVLKSVIDPTQYESLTTKSPAYLNLSNMPRMLPYWLGIQLPPHVLNYHIEDDEKTWIVENEIAPKKKSPTKMFNLRKSELKSYQVKEYTNVYCTIQKDNQKKTAKIGIESQESEEVKVKEVVKRELNSEHFDTKEVDRIIAQRQDTPDEGEVSVIHLDNDEESQEADEFFRRLDCQDDFSTVGKKEQTRERKMIAKNLKECKILSEEEMDSLKSKSVWNLRIEDKWRLYKSWHYLYNKHVRQELEELRLEYERKLRAFSEIRTEEELVIARGALVIGLTTSGAAKYRQFVQNLRSKVVIVEEAAEVLEAQVVTSLSKDTQHLVLIGDHQQLRPNPVVYELATVYHLDVSLFERLIKNGLPYVTLGIQHRMRPCISNLLVPTIYSELQDHNIVLNYEEIKGFKKNMFFLSHESLEICPEHDSTSRVNLHEAEFIVALCQYVLKQGYHQNQITILTTYQGQLSAIRRLMPKNWDKVQATVVDNYQGEENDIILLSFVRSNEGGIIGFLKTANRVCVALSRAKMGLYCIGNFDLLARQSELWTKIRNSLIETDSIGKKLELVCQLHSCVTAVSKANDFQNVINGGCDKNCNFDLECGHKCNRKCHPLDTEHEEYECTYPCEKILSCNHKCTRLCHQNCGECREEVSKLIEKCGHSIKVSCRDMDTEVVCNMPCSLHKNCGHPCQGKCGQPCRQCSVQIKVKLTTCGHEVITTCFLKDKGNCKERCSKVLSCGHRCFNMCGENCGPCTVKVKAVGICFHTVDIQCKDKNNREELRKVCHEKCTLKLPCTHQCKNRCGQPCTSFCNEEVIITPSCGHPFQTQCNLVPELNIQALMENCQAKCRSPLECGHLCTGTCSSCFRGRLHVPCRHKCDRFLVCGHLCQDICSVSCAPCRQICQNRCAHTFCQQMCGYPCILCQENCESSCVHRACVNICDSLCNTPPCDQPCDRMLPCGHPCMGICGELCPYLCRVCHKSYLIEFGENLKFLQLEDCGHTFEISEISVYLQYQMTSAVYILRCPCCYVPIRRSTYFRHFIKFANLNIEKFKLYYFSIYEHTAEPQNSLKQKLNELIIHFQSVKRSNSDWVFKLVRYMKNFLEPGYLISHAILCTFINNIEIVMAMLDIEASLLACPGNDPEFLKIKTELTQYFVTFANIVASRMTNTAFCGSLQVSNDLLRETSRLRLATQLLETFSMFYAGQSTEFKKCFEDMFSILLFQSHDQITSNELLAKHKLKLIEILGFEPIEETQPEAIQLVEPMAYAAGNWYTCPNGHINCIPTSLLDQPVWPSCTECKADIV